MYKGPEDVNPNQVKVLVKRVKERLPKLTSRLAEEKGKSEPDELLIEDLEVRISGFERLLKSKA
tara:strand:+ start:11030 stop:11221 length:192 start_codon:yes stop_codon:yes gene_type:complete